MEMAEYIDREAAVNAVLNLAPKVDDDGYCWVIRGDAARAIDSIPAADVRPVVLCRYCKFAPIGDKDGSDLEWPFNEFDENPCPYKCLDNWYSHKPAPDFFCAAGEKREES